MVLWVCAFWFVGTCVVPRCAGALGVDHSALSSRSQALYSLAIDLAEGVIGLALLRYCLREHLPTASHWRTWFRCELGGVLKWAAWAGLGAMAAFPMVERLAELNGALIPDLAQAALEVALAGEDHVATLLYCAVVSVCAPAWEEVLFRGFLQQSLAKYLPPPVAVLASALLFACAHFSAHRMLPLTALGVALGTLFNIAGRNLLPCMLLHSAWNLYVLLILLPKA